MAGLQAALTAAEHSDVVVLAKGSLDESNTAYAQGGIAAVADTENDDIEGHLRDTMVAGAGLCDEAVVRRIVSRASEQMSQLAELGMPFDLDADGRVALGREGGHRAARILHAHGDATGRALSDTLITAVRNHESIRVFENCFALDLLTDEAEPDHCLGVITHHPRHGLQVIWAAATILATGGSGQVYRETTNPNVATGDGLAMAYRAGAEVADLEFNQFHPTALYLAGASRLLISEAVRGEGATLVNSQGERFMTGIHELAELAPRDIVAGAIYRQLADSGDTSVFLDTRHIGAERFHKRFPSITAMLRQFDIEPSTDLIPIRPAAHYAIGGVWVGESGRTNLAGLYACGEVACTGLHGANRLASNSLLEGLVCGEEVGLHCRAAVEEERRAPRRIVSDVTGADRPVDLDDIFQSLKSVMWRHVGIERSGDALADAIARLDLWASYSLEGVFEERESWEVQNLLWVASLIARAAAQRQESRGTHCRTDFPETDQELAMHLTWRRGQHSPGRETSMPQR